MSGTIPLPNAMIVKCMAHVHSAFGACNALDAVSPPDKNWLQFFLSLIAPARSAGASYSETGVSNDQVSIHPSVRPMYVMKKRAKHRMVSAPARHGIYNGDFFSRFSRCRRKLRLRGEGMICRDPKKVDFFNFLIIPIMPTYAVPER